VAASKVPSSGAQEVIADGKPRLLDFGITNDSLGSRARLRRQAAGFVERGTEPP